MGINSALCTAGMPQHAMIKGQRGTARHCPTTLHWSALFLQAKAGECCRPSVCRLPLYGVASCTGTDSHSAIIHTGGAAQLPACGRLLQDSYHVLAVTVRLIRLSFSPANTKSNRSLQFRGSGASGVIDICPVVRPLLANMCGSQWRVPFMALILFLFKKTTGP
jgi:hypothetical protein